MRKTDDIEEYFNAQMLEYCKARDNNNSGKALSIRNELILYLYQDNKVSNTLIRYYMGFQEKNSDKSSSTYFGYERGDAINDIVVSFCTHISEYDPVKFPRFVAWFNVVTKNTLYTEFRKDMKQTNVYIEDGSCQKQLVPLLKSTDNVKSNPDTGDEISVFDDRDSGDMPVDIRAEEKYALKEKRMKLLSVITLFFKRNSSNSKTIKRFSYYKIFTTEIIVKDIRDNSSVSIYGNNSNEILQAVDNDYINFFASGYRNIITDIITMKIRNYSDIIEGSEEQPVKLRHEPRVIIPYRAKAGLDETPVSAANVSQQYSNYIKDVQIILEKAGANVEAV